MKDASPNPTSLEGGQCNSIIEDIVVKNDIAAIESKWKHQQFFTYMRQNVMDQKSNEIAHPATAKVQIDNPTPISLKGLWL